MSELIYQFINIIRLTTGRRLYALQRIREVAEKQGNEKLIGIVDEAVTHDNDVYKQELAYRRSKELPEARGNALQLDLQIDRVLGAIYRHLENLLIAMEGTDLAKQARTLLARLFPAGLKPVVHQTFEEQLSNNKAILAALQSDEQMVNTMGLVPFQDRLAELVPQFDTELQANKKPEVSWDELCSLRDKGNVHLRRVVAVVLSTGGLTPHDEAVRTELLAPVVYQVERIANARHDRSGSVDVDPQTGDEVVATAPDNVQ